ncbi:MAG: PorV/PorQ family protein [Candidatus Marinimicrobia bacterium]|nr:PorV/PorQ family protein [Candidatus Neomarinimicrobiota bacterium]
MRCIKKIVMSLAIFFNLFWLTNPVLASGPYRVGTTAANFLELGFGGAGCAMGDAYVSVTRDISSIYWNPAGLGYMENNQFIGELQPWIVDINFSMGAFGYVHPTFGTFALSFMNTSFGEEVVTTVNDPEGYGQTFTGQDIALQVSYGRKLAQWFSFGATGKYINSRIWKSDASAFAFDLGAIVNTNFLNWTGEPGDGINIGMCISNYGTKLRYTGQNIKDRLDISDDHGNYQYLPVNYDTEAWELPLIFRIGLSFKPILTDNHVLTVSADALHPNNNSESVNVGGEYKLKIQPVGTFSLRGGYKALFMDKSEYGVTFGGGFQKNMLNNYTLSVNYALRDFGTLGYLSSYSIGLSF